MSDELRILLMGYLDGELDDADRARIEAELDSNESLRREYEEMRRLKDIADGAGYDARTDEELDVFWNEVYNRLERQTAWVLLVLGFVGIIFACGYLFFTHTGTHWMVKAAGACGAVGTLLLLWSVWRERRRILPHDRYSREVHR